MLRSCVVVFLLISHTSSNILRSCVVIFLLISHTSSNITCWEAALSYFFNTPHVLKYYMLRSCVVVFLLIFHTSPNIFWDEKRKLENFARMILEVWWVWRLVHLFNPVFRQTPPIIKYQEGRLKTIENCDWFRPEV